MGRSRHSGPFGEKVYVEVEALFSGEDGALKRELGDVSVSEKEDKFVSFALVEGESERRHAKEELLEVEGETGSRVEGEERDGKRPAPLMRLIASFLGKKRVR